MTEIAAHTAAVIGAFFIFVGSFGVLRLDEFYLRIHGPTKAATLGLLFLLMAVLLTMREMDVFAKAVLVGLFVAATVPAGAHMLCRTAYHSGVRQKNPRARDAYAAAVARRRSKPGRSTFPARDLEED